MKQLHERVKDYKIMKRAILENESSNGYSVKYEGGRVFFTYRELNGHLLTEQNGHAVHILNPVDRQHRLFYQLDLIFFRTL